MSKKVFPVIVLMLALSNSFILHAMQQGREDFSTTSCQKVPSGREINPLYHRLLSILKQSDKSLQESNVPKIKSIIQYVFADGKTILHKAVALARTAEDIALLEEIIRQNDRLLFTVDKHGHCCLWDCSCIEVFEFLIKKMVKKNAHTLKECVNLIDDTRIPLLLYCINQRLLPNTDKDMLLRMIRLCIESGASICPGKPAGDLIFRNAYYTNDIDVGVLLRKIIFLRAAMKTSVDHAHRYFLDMARKNMCPSPSDTVFCKEIKEDILTTLIDPSDSFVCAVAKSAYGIGRYAAPSQKHRNILQDMVQFCGLESNIEIIPGVYLIHAATMCNDVAMIRVLLQHSNATSTRNIFDIVDGDGNTALHIALLRNNIEAAKLLIEYSDISIENKVGMTPIELIVRCRRELLDYCSLLQKECIPSFILLPIAEKIVLEKVYKTIAFLSYENAQEYIRINRECIGADECEKVLQLIEVYREDRCPGMPLIACSAKRYCSSEERVYKDSWDVFSSYGILSYTHELGNLSIDHHPLFIAIKECNQELIKKIIKCDFAIVFVKFFGTTFLDVAIDNYIDSRGSLDCTICEKYLSIVRLLLDLGANFFETKYRDDSFDEDSALKNVLDPYRRESCTRVIAHYLDNPYYLEPIINSFIEHLFLSKKDDNTWYEQRSILLYALYYIDRLRTIAPELVNQNKIEHVLLCTLCISNKLLNDCRIINFLTYVNPDEHDLPRLRQLCINIFSQLHTSCCSQDQWEMFPSIETLNTFFIKKVYGGENSVGALSIGGLLFSKPSSTPFFEDPFFG